MKECTKCKESKELEDFPKRTSSKDGYNTQCKVCIALTKKKWAEENTDKIKVARENNRENILKSRKKWNDNNKDYNKKYKRKYSRYEREKERMLVDDLYKCKRKITKSIGCVIRENIHKTNYKKDTKTIEILGCSFEYFKSYIENNFEPWMTWENYGIYNGEFNYGWDFDHIIPITKAVDKDEVLRLNHYTNFQPLCSKMNRDIKRDKLY